MSRAQIVRLAGLVLPALCALAISLVSHSWWITLLAFAAAFLAGIPVERLYRRLASSQELQRDLEDRVRNPPA